MSKIRLTAVLIVSVLLSLTAVAMAATIRGTNGDDFLVGTLRNDEINARGGDDTVFGLRGNDEIEGGRGDDRLFGDGDCPPGVTDPDYCDEEARDDDDDDDDDREKRKRRARFNDDIDGGRGNDFISGGPGSDEIDAEDNQVDTIRCGPGRDRVEADFGDDVASDCERVRRG